MQVMAGRNVTWVKSQKGHDQLVIDNFIFVVNGKGRDPHVRYWSCKTNGCSVTAKTQGHQLVEINQLPNPPDHGHINNVTELRNMELKVNYEYNCTLIVCYTGRPRFKVT